MSPRRKRLPVLHRDSSSPDDGSFTLDRRTFNKILASLPLLLSASCGDDLEQLAANGYLLPPPDATVKTTACAYCIVGCGYKSYTWAVGSPSGGPGATDNAFGVEFPVPALAGVWISPPMYNITMIDGIPHHIVIVPDHEATVVNVGGDHNLGGTLAQRFYSSDGATKDRLLTPSLRIGTERVPLTWDEAVAIVAQTSRHVIDEYGPAAWAVKSYSYQFYENTYAISKLCFDSVKTPAWAPHDQPADGPSTPGLSDAGINAFSAAYADWLASDVLFVSGVGLYEQRAILFSQWVARGPQLIVVNPRRDETADYALENGGMFLQIRPGTDTALHSALAYEILSNGWHDADFVAASTVSAADLARETSSRRVRFGQTFDQYRTFILGSPAHSPEAAAAIIGIPAADIREAARRLAAPRSGGTTPKTSFMLEKGNYWSHNYANSASLVSLGLLVGAGNRPGRMIARGGGHQRGMISAAAYPLAASPDLLDGVRVPMNLDLALLRGDFRMAWVIGCTWFGGGSAHPHALFETVKTKTVSTALPQLSEATAFPRGRGGGVDVAYVVATLRARADAGGMVVVQQDIYPQAQTEFADIVLSAAAWGEAPFTRMQGERRLRLYSHLADAPGQCLPDWQIVSRIAKAMGYTGFDWQDGNAVFEEAAARSRNTEHDYTELVALASAQGRRAHDVLGDLGTTGIQCPITQKDGSLVGTVRLHERGFSTASGRALFVRADYATLVAPRQARFAPRADELWIINRRSGSTWSSLVEDLRIPYRVEQLPENLLELHPDDARRLGISTGDEVVVSTDGLLDASLTGRGLPDTGFFRARAVVGSEMQPGVACTYFNFRGTPEFASNGVVPNVPDPVSNLFSFKLGRGKVSRA